MTLIIIKQNIYDTLIKLSKYLITPKERALWLLFGISELPASPLFAFLFLTFLIILLMEKTMTVQEDET